MPKPKIAMIGAGSLIFCKTLTMDILATKALQDSEICLMDQTKPKLDKMEAFVKGMVKENKLPAKVTATLDRRKALDGAQYVINMIQVGGVEAFRVDYEIPLQVRRRSVHRGFPRSGRRLSRLRTIPVLAEMSADMNELCPEAILLNYANPMGANCSALGRVAKVQFIGLCHGVQTTLDLISRYVDVPKDQVDFVCAGINHMAWFLVPAGQTRRPRPVPDPPQEHREARVLRQREGPRRGHAALRLLHDREHGASVGVRAVVPQQPAGAGPVLRPAGLRRGVRGLLQLLQHARGEVQERGLPGDGIEEDPASQRRILLVHPRSRRDRQRRSGSTATCATTATSRTCRRAAAWKCRSSWMRAGCIRCGSALCRRNVRP